MTELPNILFLDSETIPRQPWSETDPKLQELFQKKFRKRFIDEFSYYDSKATSEWESLWNELAPVHAEFNTVISLCLGVVVSTSSVDAKGRLYVRAFSGTEFEILTQFVAITEKVKPNAVCAHNGLGFDFPVLLRKLIIHGLVVPPVLEMRGKKPWEVSVIDTMQLWACGEFRHMVSLDLLCHIFGLPSPKTDLDGSKVYEAFKAGRIQDINRYCCQDVVALVNCYCKIKGYAIAYGEGDTEFKI